MAPRNLYELLQQASLDPADHAISIYEKGDVGQIGRRLPYSELFQIAKTYACLLPQVIGISPKSIVLLHFDNHYDSIVWFWSVVAAGYLPAISTPFTNDLEQRKSHLIHLKTLLKDPVIITTEKLVPNFLVVDGLNIQTAEVIRGLGEKHAEVAAPFECNGSMKQENDPAVLMLTSGSSGNAKAVSLCHGQMLASINGKSNHHDTTKADRFLNWIGLDHVANLTESHLHAMLHPADQIHVHASDLLVNPLRFLSLVDKHRITHSFAPNFFLASLRTQLEKSDAFSGTEEPELSCFRVLISGGEANVVETCSALTQLMSKYGVHGDFIRPGFGMTETCAGSIYNKECSSYDTSNKSEFASLGTCIPGLSIRISNGSGEILPVNTIGNLEVSGPVVFREYYNNFAATAESFTADGWFITGDQALIDSNGRLSLTGRAKESIIINGVKYFPHEVESAIEDSRIEGLTPSYTVVFPHRPKRSQTEVLCVVYLPTYKPDNIVSRVNTTDAISSISIMQCGVRPYQIIPLDTTLLPKSSLGKLSRAKIRAAFENGTYANYQRVNEDLIYDYRATQRQAPTTDTEATILQVFAELFEIPKENVGINTSLFEMGVSSIEIIKLKQKIQVELKLEVEIPVITMMTHPTIKGLAEELLSLKEPKAYSPVVTLQNKGSKAPLWLIHPGVGEILVFLNLAKYIMDRPIHALRARGFDSEEFFKDIPEVIDTYHKAIKEVQPEGPYAIAGYSYGAMLAFETTKILESHGDKVEFLGVFNLPPHIKFRMRQLDWIEVLLNLSYFLDLITDDYAHEISPAMHERTHEQVLDHIVSQAARTRMEEMGLDQKKLANWSDLAYRMQAIAQNYDPSGMVASMDVFYAIPLSAVSKSKEEWLQNHLSRWKEFVATPVRFHEVDGAHYTMISPTHVHTFQKTLRVALQERGL